MRRLAFVALLALLPTSAALADGCPPSTCGSTSVVQPGSRVLVLRPSGQSGPALGYDLVARRWRFSLPSGMLSADGTTFVSARSRQGRAFTEVLRYNARTGRVRSRWPVGGRRMGVVAVSADGRSVGLAETRRNGVVIAVAGRRGRSVISLHGNYQVEGLSPDGRRVYLVHWSRTGYALENVDLVTRRVHPTKLADPDERMEGAALTAVGTRDGRWLHTLYVKANGESFVHALDLATGVGHCVDLPLRGDSFTLGATTLTLSPDERRLYLASPLRGRVTTVDLERLRVSRVARFRPVPLARYFVGAPLTAAVSANGRMLAFTLGARLWLYDVAYGGVRRPVWSPHGIAGVGFRPDGRQVVAVGGAGDAATFDAATGKRYR
jgi:dipeptidyl aminopeptidase/acylaminoacyl peptidase